LLLNIHIITDYPLWFSIFCVLLGAGYAFVLYRKEERFSEVTPWLVKAMAGFRFLLVSILAFLLLSPFIKTLFNKVEKPVIVIVQDNSSSVLLNKDSAFYRNEYIQQMQGLVKELETDFEVKAYTFGDQMTEGLTINYAEKITNLSNVFDELTHKFYNRNVGALILASDGIFNQGSNPVYSTAVNYPVYTVAMGDTSMKKDINLKEVTHNKLTFLGNQFQLEIEAEMLQCNQESTALTIFHNGVELFNKKFESNLPYYKVSENVLLEAKEVGVQHYKIVFSKLDGEVSYENNVKDVYIEVLDGRQNVLILATSPHPDIKALKLSIENNENYKVTHQLINEFDGNIEPYSLVVVHQFPVAMSAGFKKVIESNISKWYVLSSGSAMSNFNSIETGLSITQSGNKMNEIVGAAAANFPLFTLSESTIKRIKLFPPVVGPFGNYSLKTNGYTLLNQQIGSVETEDPLLVFFQNTGNKSAVFAGEGLWKWRMQDFLKNKNHEAFDELINKTVQFLSVKEDKSKFRIFTKNIYFENEEIRFNAELYNDSYELNNEPEININVSGVNGEEYKFVFNRTSNAYILNAGILPAGSYTYVAQTKLGAKDYSEVGKFQIKALMLESNNTMADHQLMQNIGEKFGGELYYPNQLKELSAAIVTNNDIASIIYEENDLKELIDLKWIFFVLMILLSLEWFFRKRNGAY
jgi:hypothetical protein